MFQVLPHDLPKRRIHGKSSPVLPQQQPDPSLRSLREGGEHDGGRSSEAAQEDQGQDGGRSSEAAQEDEEREQEKVLEQASLQHQRLQELLQEDEVRMREGTLMRAEVTSIMKVAEEIRILEAKLQAEVGWRQEIETKLQKLEAAVEMEVLQTRTVPLEEVRKDLQGWVEAFKKEVDMLTAGPVTRLTREEYIKLCQQGTPMETLPTKMVATVKPPGRRKGRIVVCGNFADEKSTDTSIGGICSVALRGTVYAAAVNGWSLGTVDVKGAFLQAPRRDTGKVLVVQPPALLLQMGLAQPGEMWLVHQALYGYVESPSDWGHFRDNEGLSKMERETEEKVKYRLVPSGEPHLWRIQADGQTQGVILVYVDDFLVAGKVRTSALKAIARTWECSDPEIINEESWVRYCGYEIRQGPHGSFQLRQTSYITDVLERRNVQKEEAVPLPRIEEGPDEENPEVSVIRDAQAAVGELM